MTEWNHFTYDISSSPFKRLMIFLSNIAITQSISSGKKLASHLTEIVKVICMAVKKTNKLFCIFLSCET